MVFKKKFTITFVNGFFMILSILAPIIEACIRIPQGASGDNSPVDDNFRITIDGNPASYLPGQAYNVTLSCDKAFKFISFTLVAEAEPGTPYGIDMTGHFDIIDPAETRFSNQCENMIESSNTNIKQRVDVAWVAPNNRNSTCIYIKAAVLQHRDIWFIDDGFLTKRICPEEVDDVNSQTPAVNPCCACDEAKYELVVERHWTRNTHAKDFPKDDWRTRFSELLGASHAYDYRFWAYGSRASPGLKEMAEHGATKTLESEIKEHTESGSIRTIIKAPGVPFRKNVLTSTLATVRVDPRHHMVSFVTKIIPSPDWILGVAGLELCLANCTWIDKKVLNLFPWDAGTDSGPSYMSPDEPQNPADVVRRISSTYPSDHRSPFYDETLAPMKPMATLRITRKKLYERECEEDDNVPLECATHPWVEWTECSTKCGAGSQYRTRNYKDLGLAARYNCEVPLRQTQRCVGTLCGLQEDDEEYGPQTAECELTSWSNWSPCSASCGRGYSRRTRDYRNPYAHENCQSGLSVQLEERKECSGIACGGSITSGYGTDNGEFDQYSREPGLMEENNINTDYDRRNQYGRPKVPTRFNEKWSIDDRSTSFGDIDKNGFGTNFRNNEEPAMNFGMYDNNNDRNFAQNNFADNNRGNNFGFTNNNDNNFNGNRYSNQRAENSNPYNSFDNSNFNINNGNDNNNYDAYQNKQDSFDNSNNFNSEMMPQVYNQRLPSERVTDQFKSPGFNPPRGTPDSDQYNTVLEFCFEKPIVVRKSCAGKKIISNFWFFDADDRECKIFTTDNCDENKNKFRSIESCEGDCLQPLLNLEQEQLQQSLPDQSNRNDPYGNLFSSINNNNRRQQNYNLNNQPRQRNQMYFNQKRV